MAERLRFANAAPKRLRSERLPAPLRAELESLWDGVVGDIYDEVAGVSRTELLRGGRIERALRRIGDRLLETEKVVIVTAVHYPLRNPGVNRHLALAGLGGGSAAAAEEVAMFASAGTATAVAILSAVAGEVFETYVAASARTQLYRAAHRSPDPNVVLTDLAEAAGYGTSMGRRATPTLAADAATWLAQKIIVRTGARFARSLVPVIGVALGAGTSIVNVRRVAQQPLRPPSPEEVVRLADDVIGDPDAYARARADFLELPNGE